MSFRRFRQVFQQDLAHNAKRPLFWVLLLILGLNAYAVSVGALRIRSGDSDVGGVKAYINSEFAFSQQLALFFLAFDSFFIAVASGMAVINDDEMQVGEILHATPLTPREYIWGKFSAVVATFLGVLIIQALLTMFFVHVVPNADQAEFRGPFVLRAYFRPLIFLTLPTLIFMAGTCFAIGERVRKAVLVFFVPVASFLLCTFFLWNWSPSWLSYRWNHILMLLDPTGFRWLSQTWLRVDRGTAFYNHQPVAYDAPFLLSRAAFILLGLALVAYSSWRFGKELRGDRKVSAKKTKVVLPEVVEAQTQSLESIAMRSRPPAFLSATFQVMRFELRELASQAGLYLFIPIILLNTILGSLFAVGAFSTPLLLTSGTFAVNVMDQLGTLICLLLLFYTVESLNRETNTRIGGIYYSTPVPTSSILAGKALANSFIGFVIILAAFIASVIILLVQRTVRLEMWPFFLVWGLLLMPTFILWTSFVNLVQAIAGNRYVTYAVGLGALILTGYLINKNKVNWVGNWPLWNSVVWSDLGTFEIDRQALWLNRLFALALAAGFTVLAVHFHGRRSRDAVNVLNQFKPRPLLKSVLRLSPALVLPLVLGISLYVKVDHGYESNSLKKDGKDYWRKNIATYRDYPVPSIRHIDADIDIDPSARSFKVNGKFLLGNHNPSKLEKILLSTPGYFEGVTWTWNGDAVKPEDRKGLNVFTPSEPMEPNATAEVGFSYRGVFPKGVSSNGGGAGTFILPSGIQLTDTSIFPTIGFVDGIGVDEENSTDAKEYPDDYYLQVVPPLFGSPLPFTTNLRITGPANYRFNAVGTLQSDESKDGKRTMVWVSDHPIEGISLIGSANWAVRKGAGTEIYYYPGHSYNIDEMGLALDSARKYYSEWFHEYPWKDLRLSEFPALASYAQGFNTNITFSESIGFLTKSDPKANAAFMVTSHESAHQWWGNLVDPGKGPSGNILSEGMAHFSTALLFEQVKGEQQRMNFMKGIEDSYANTRQVDSERPMVNILGSRAGDGTVTYDKGGWVFYMLCERMGRPTCLSGLQDFIKQYEYNPHHPLLQDFIRVMRTHAQDSAGFDDFSQQWFYSVVVPQYQFSDTKRTQNTDGSWDVSFKITNIGTGKMPMTVAATHADRYLPQKDARQPDKPNPDYKDVRSSIILGAGESQIVTLHCDFKPDKVVADPDIKILQLKRKLAVATL